MRNKNFNIIGIGSALLDISANIDDEFLAHNKIAKGQMTLTQGDELKNYIKNLTIEKITSGGASANVLVMASALGAKPAFIGMVGDDEAGEKYKDELEKANVCWVGGTLSKSNSGICLSLISPNAERSMMTDLGSSTKLDEGVLDEEVLSSAKILLLEGYLWDSENAKKTAIKAAKTVKNKAQNCLIAFSLSDSFCVERNLSGFRDFVEKNVDILIANEMEIKSFYQLNDLNEIVEKIKQQNFAFCAVTRSEKGAIVFEKNQPIIIEASPIKKLVDSTGAGDAFAGGFLYAIIEGLGAKKGGELGAKAASKIVQIYGTRE